MLVNNQHPVDICEFAVYFHIIATLNVKITIHENVNLFTVRVDFTLRVATHMLMFEC